MKALSLWQPWASLMAFGEKKVETRCWKTKYRGPIAIASTASREPLPGIGMSRDSKLFREYFRIVSERHGWREWYWPQVVDNYVDIRGEGERHARVQADYGFGAILCVAELVEIHETDEVRDDLTDQERCFGNYEAGRYAWFFENVKRLDRPIPAKGNRLLWNWEPPEGFNGRV